MKKTKVKKSLLKKTSVRKLEIEDRPLIIVDGLFKENEIKEWYSELKALSYSLSDYDTENTAFSRHWKSEWDVKQNDLDQFLLVSKILATTNDYFPQFKSKLNRIHSNLHLYGDLQFPHVDCEKGCTAIYYANSDWDPNWTGETIFFNSQKEAIYAIAPKPGRVVIFDGTILHRAGVPSRQCFEPRITLAFKFGY